MSRSGYSDDCENLGLWRGAVSKAINGKRGQTLLKDLLKALDEMPEKRLIRMNLKTETGEFCTLGVLGAKRGINMEEIDPEDSETVANEFNIADAMAKEIVYMNDEHYDNCSPEERWVKMRNWIFLNIKDDDNDSDQK